MSYKYKMVSEDGTPYLHPIVEWAQTEGYKLYPELAAYGTRLLTVDYTFTTIRTPTENGYIETITDSQGNTSVKTVIKNDDGSVTITTKGQYVDKNDPGSGRNIGDQSWNTDYVFYPDKVTIEKRWDFQLDDYGQSISYKYQNSDDCNEISLDEIEMGSSVNPADVPSDVIANICLENAPVKQWYGATYNSAGLINAYNISYQSNGSHNISVYDIDYNLLGFKINDTQSYWYYYHIDGKHGSSYTVTYQKDTQTTYEWDSSGQISHISQDVLFENYEEDIDEPDGFFNSTVGQICLIVVSAVLIAYTGGAAAGVLAGVLGGSSLAGITAACLGYFAAGTVVATLRNLMLGYSFDEAFQMGLKTGVISGLSAGVFQGLESTQILSDIGKGINWLIDKIPGLDSITNTISSGWNFLTDNILSDAINWLGNSIGYHSGNSLWNMFIDKTVDILLAYYGMEAAGGETWGASLAGLVSGGLDPNRTALTGTLGWGSQAAASQGLEGSQWQNPVAAVAGMFGEGLGTALSGGAENFPEALAAALQGCEDAVISGLVSAAIIGELGDEFGIDDAGRQEASLLFDIISSDNQFKQGVKIIADAGLSALIQTIDPDMDPLTSGLIQIGISALIADLAMGNVGFIDILKKNIGDILAANNNANTASYMAYLDSVMDLAKSIIELGFDKAIEQYAANGLHQAASDNIAMAINYIKELREWRKNPAVIANAQALGLDINSLTPEQFDQAMAEWRNKPENIANAQALGLDINGLTPLSLNQAIEEWRKDPTAIANANLLKLDINTLTPVTLNQAIDEWKKDPAVIANADLLGLDINTLTPITLNQAIDEWKKNPIIISNAEELELDITTLTPEEYNKELTEWRENTVTIIQAEAFGLDTSTLTPLTLNEELSTLSRFATLLGLDIYCLTPEEFDQILGKWRNSIATIGNADALELDSSTVTPGQLNQAIAEWRNNLDETTITIAQTLGLDINTLTPHLLNEWKKLLTNLGLNINDSNLANTLNEQLNFNVNTTLQNTYVVKEDNYSLRDIANEIYGSPDMWKAIAQINGLNIGEADTDYIFTSAGKELILPKQILEIDNTPVFIFDSELWWNTIRKGSSGACSGSYAFYLPSVKAVFINEDLPIAIFHELMHAKHYADLDALDDSYWDFRRSFSEIPGTAAYFELCDQLAAAEQAMCQIYESCYGKVPHDSQVRSELFASIYSLSGDSSDVYIQQVANTFNTKCSGAFDHWSCSVIPFVTTLLAYSETREFLARYYGSLGLPVPELLNPNNSQPSDTGENNTPTIPDSTNESEPNVNPSDIPGDIIPQNTYTVQEGDTLWGIALNIYGDGNMWREIANANNLEIQAGDAVIIFPNQQLVLPSQISNNGNNNPLNEKWGNNIGPEIKYNADVIGLTGVFTQEQYNQVLAKWRSELAPEIIAKIDLLGLNTETFTPWQASEAMDMLSETAERLEINVNNCTVEEFKQVLVELILDKLIPDDGELDLDIDNILGFDFNNLTLEQLAQLEQLNFCSNIPQQSIYITEGNTSLRELAEQIYGNAEMWKVIAKFNGYPTDDSDHIVLGANQEIILPIAKFQILDATILIFDSIGWENLKDLYKRSSSVLGFAIRELIFLPEKFDSDIFYHELAHVQQHGNEKAMENAFTGFYSLLLQTGDNQLTSYFEDFKNMLIQDYASVMTLPKFFGELFALLYGYAYTPDANDRSWIEDLADSFVYLFGIDCGTDAYCFVDRVINAIDNYPQIKQFLGQYYQSLSLPVPAYFNTNATPTLDLPTGDLTGVLP